MSVVAYAPGSTVPGLLAAEADGLDYYAGTKETVKYSDVNLVYRNNVVFNLSNVNGGASSVYISPYAGALGTIMLACQFKADTVQGGSWSTGAVLPRSWLWNALDYVQFRYANGDTFQLTSQQMMIQAIKTCSDSYVANKMMQLAGQALYTPDDNGVAGTNPFLVPTDKLWGYIPICLPHAQAQGENAGKGLRMDLLGSPVQLIVKMKAPSEILTGVPVGQAVPTAYDSVFIQCKQIMPAEGQSLPRSMKPLPIVFQQQQNQVSVSFGANDKSKAIQLVGFRSGSVKCLDIWVVPSTATALTFNQFVLPSDIKLDFMGNRLYVGDGYSSQFWNLTYSKNLTSWDNASLAAGAVNDTYVASDIVSSWVQIPFSAFHTELKADDAVSSSGIAIQNGQLTLTLTLPTGDYTVYYSADIEAAIDYEDHSAKYVF